MTVTVRNPLRLIAAVLLVAVVATSAYFLGRGGRATAATRQTAQSTGSAEGGAPAVTAIQPRPTPPIAVGASPGITVIGTGSISGTPDTLDVELGADVTSGTVSGALDGMSSALAGMRRSLLASGVAAKDLQTSGLSVQPQYGDGMTLRGYEATETLSAKLHDLSRAGAAVTAAVAAGGSAARVNQLSLDLSDDSALLVQARQRAFADAKAKATQYAALAGRSLGPVITVSEADTTPVPVPLGFDNAKRAPIASAVPVDPGQQQISVQVQVAWALSG